jgi:hypothetical protein
LRYTADRVSAIDAIPLAGEAETGNGKVGLYDDPVKNKKTS